MIKMNANEKQHSEERYTLKKIMIRTVILGLVLVTHVSIVCTYWIVVVEKERGVVRSGAIEKRPPGNESFSIDKLKLSSKIH